MRLVSWATTLSRDFAEAEGFEPPTFGFGDRHSTNCARPMVALLAKNYAPIVEVEGLEPTKPNGGRFTVCSRCRWRTPQYICGTSWSRTTFSGFSVLRIHQVCQSSIRGGRRIRTFGALQLGTLAVCWFRPLTHTSIGFRVQRYNATLQPFCVTRKKLQKKIIIR